MMRVEMRTNLDEVKNDMLNIERRFNESLKDIRKNEKTLMNFLNISE